MIKVKFNFKQVNQDYFTLHRIKISKNQQELTQNQINAFEQAKKGIIPNEQYQFDPELRDNHGNTICYYLWDNGIYVPERWQDEQYKNPLRYDNFEYEDQESFWNQYQYCNVTEAMKDAIQGKIPNIKYYHNPNIQDKYNNTVAYHLKLNKLPVPNEWYGEDMKDTPKNSEFVQQALYGIIPKKPDNIQPDYDCGYGWTIAMLLAMNGKNIPNEWKHDKLLRNNNDNTISMIYAKYGHIPPQEWNHQFDLSNKNGNTVAMLLAKNKIISPKKWEHKPEIANNGGWTVAMYLAFNKIIPPSQWNHKPKIQDSKGYTVTMYLAKNGLDIPEQWRHDKLLKNNNDQTVAIIQSSQGNVPDQYWMHDVDLQDNDGNSIRSNLLKYNYIYQNGQFIYNIQTEIKQSICSICLNDGEQEFIKTKCGHNICLECFKELVKQKKQNNFPNCPNCPNCPECRQEDWIIPIDDNQYQQYLNQLNKHKY